MLHKLAINQDNISMHNFMTLHISRYQIFLCQFWVLYTPQNNYGTELTWFTRYVWEKLHTGNKCKNSLGGRPLSKLVTWLHDSVLGGPGECISAAFPFFAFVYIGDGSTPVTFLIWFCFWFFGYLVGKFSKFCRDA